MKISETVQAVADFAPVQLAAEWDNVGFLVGDEERECTGVVTCLDCTEEVIDKAVAEGCNLIVSHHPFIFKGIRELNLCRTQSRAIEKLFKHDISVYSAHTNLDVAENGLSHKLAEMFGGENIVREGFGCFAELRPVSAKELAKRVAEVLGDKSVKVCAPDATVRRIYVISGSGGGSEELEIAMKSADALVTGNVRHNVFTDAAQENFPIVEFSHFYSEIICCDVLNESIKSRFGELKVVSARQQCPYKTLEEL